MGKPETKVVCAVCGSMSHATHNHFLATGKAPAQFEHSIIIAGRRFQWCAQAQQWECFLECGGLLTCTQLDNGGFRVAMFAQTGHLVCTETVDAATHGAADVALGNLQAKLRQMAHLVPSDGMVPPSEGLQSGIAIENANRRREATHGWRNPPPANDEENES